MSTYGKIGPSLKYRWNFVKGHFTIEKGLIGYHIVREDLFAHEVLWDTMANWHATYQEIYVYKMFHVFTKSTAEKLLTLLNELYAGDSVIPKHQINVSEYLYNTTFRKDELMSEIRRREKLSKYLK